MQDAGGAGGQVRVSVAGLHGLARQLRQVERTGDDRRLPDLVRPPTVGRAVEDLAQALCGGQTAIDDELELLVAFVDAAVDAFQHLDRASVAGRLA